MSSIHIQLIVLGLLNILNYKGHSNFLWFGHVKTYYSLLILIGFMNEDGGNQPAAFPFIDVKRQITIIIMIGTEK